MEPDRDFWWHDLMSMPIASPKCETEEMDAEDPLFILYTSGTTGKPKGLVHTHGGYTVYTSTTFRYVFDYQPEDRWWCAADPGCIIGHSYIVYSPMINGATTVLYEGATNYPYPNRWWQMVEKYEKQGWYLAGDSAKMDNDGYIWIIGRIDDVLKVSGYRLGSAEIESALVSHPAVTEAAAIGLPDDLRGNVIHVTVILREGFTA